MDGKAISSEETQTARQSINRAVRQAAKKLMPQPSQKTSCKKTIKEHSRLANNFLKNDNFKCAIEQYQIVLDAAYNLYIDPQHVEILKIREHIADVHTMEGSYEEALLMYSSLKDGYFKGEMNAQKVEELEGKEVTTMNKVTSCRVEKEKEQLDQWYQLGLINIQINNHRKARDLFLRVLNELRMKSGVTNDQVLIIREHLADLHVLHSERDEATAIYMSILMTMSERKEGTNWNIYEAVRQKLDDLRNEIC